MYTCIKKNTWVLVFILFVTKERQYKGNFDQPRMSAGSVYPTNDREASVTFPVCQSHKKGVHMHNEKQIPPEMLASYVK